MKIGIDANVLTRTFQHGTKRYAEELIMALASIDKKNTYILYSCKKIDIPKQKNFRLVILPKYPLLKRQLFLTLMAKKENLDIFHHIDPFGSIFVRGHHTITTVHDLDLNTVYPTLRNISFFIKRYYSEIARYFIFRNSNTLIAVSKNTAMNLKIFLGDRIKKRIEVIYEGVSNNFSESKIKNFSRNYILAMGDFSPRKNINGVFKAYGLLDSNLKLKYRLKVVVSTRAESIRIKSVAQKINILKWTQIVVAPSENELRLLYQKAFCFLYPSLYEGFGLPILEAMACGCPVITSNYGAMKEISGGNAILVNPRSVSEIKNAMLRIVKNKKLARKLSKNGIFYAKKFSWIKTAQKTLEVYNTIIRK